IFAATRFRYLAAGARIAPQPDTAQTRTRLYKSTDGGLTWREIVGGGLPPLRGRVSIAAAIGSNAQRVYLIGDFGLYRSDGGDTSSSWYNQSTEQVYHIATDNAFPYWIYATQQDAGAIATRSRGDLGTITPIDWKPVPGWEWGTILPDPRDPSMVFSSGLSISKISYPGGAWINVGPEQDPSLKLRSSLNAPIVFATWHGKQELLAGYQYVMASTDRGATWAKLSPDLTVPHPGVPTLTGVHEPARDTTMPLRAIWSVAASTVSPGVIWTGATNGIMQVSRDHGKSWSDVTIPGIEIAARPIRPAVEASGFAAGAAYAALDLHSRGDYGPYIYRT